MLFYSVHFIYVDVDGNEVLHKDAAAVTVDGTLLMKTSTSVHYFIFLFVYFIC